MIKIKSLISSCCLILGVYGHKADFITPCTWNDEKCILSSSQRAIPVFARGMPELGVPAADPLLLKDMRVKMDGLDLLLKGLSVTDIGKCQMQSISRDIKASTIELVIDCPIDAVGEYDVEGSLLSIPIYGTGPCHIKTDNMRVSAVIEIFIVDGSDGEKHWKIKNIKHTFEPIKKVYLNFENMYNGAENKAEPILKIMDTHWMDLILNIGKPIMEEVVETMASRVGKFLEAVPAKHLEITS